MMRDDYERFAEIFNEEGEIYHFYDCRNDKDVNITFGKVANTRTLVVEGADTKNLGVAIDIFPIDDLCETYEDSKKFYRKFRFLKALLVLKCRRVAEVRSWWKKPFFAIVKTLLFWYPLHRIPLIIIERVLKRRNPQSAYVGLVIDGHENEIVRRTLWTDFREIQFEGRTFMAVNDTDSYLKHAYGDYMKLPPEKDRVPKHDFYEMYWLENK